MMYYTAIVEILEGAFYIKIYMDTFFLLTDFFWLTKLLMHRQVHPHTHMHIFHTYNHTENNISTIPILIIGILKAGAAGY